MLPRGEDLLDDAPVLDEGALRRRDAFESAHRHLRVVARDDYPYLPGPDQRAQMRHGVLGAECLGASVDADAESAQSRDDLGLVKGRQTGDMEPEPLAIDVFRQEQQFGLLAPDTKRVHHEQHVDRRPRARAVTREHRAHGPGDDATRVDEPIHEAAEIRVQVEPFADDRPRAIRHACRSAVSLTARSIPPASAFTSCGGTSRPVSSCRHDLRNASDLGRDDRACCSPSPRRSRWAALLRARDDRARRWLRADPARRPRGRGTSRYRRSPSRLAQAPGVAAAARRRPRPRKRSLGRALDQALGREQQVVESLSSRRVAPRWSRRFRPPRVPSVPAPACARFSGAANRSSSMPSRATST